MTLQSQTPQTPQPEEPLPLARWLVYDGMPAHAAIECYVAQSWAFLDSDAQEHFGQGIHWTLRMLVARPEQIGPLAAALRDEDIRDPLLPTPPDEWEAYAGEEADVLLGQVARMRERMEAQTAVQTEPEPEVPR